MFKFKMKLKKSMFFVVARSLGLCRGNSLISIGICRQILINALQHKFNWVFPSFERVRFFCGSLQSIKVFCVFQNIQKLVHLVQVHLNLLFDCMRIDIFVLIFIGLFLFHLIANIQI